MESKERQNLAHGTAAQSSEAWGQQETVDLTLGPGATASLKTGLFGEPPRR